MTVSSKLRGADRALRIARGSPFRRCAGSPLIVHCSHHRTGTVWFSRILQAIASDYGLRLVEPSAGAPYLDAAIAHYSAGDFATHLPAGTQIPAGLAYRGSHMIRDPRDVVVSGYFYHLQAPEIWLHQPLERFGGLTYQQHQLAVSQHEGLLTEIWKVGQVDIPDMIGWDYSQPEFMELRYEDVMNDEADTFRRLFFHYGFNDRAVRRGVRLVERIRRSHGREVTGSNLSGPSWHVRSGASGEWRKLFTDEHVAAFKEVSGDALLRLGYEASLNWRP